MPYGYYQLVRFFSTLIFAFLSFKEFNKGNKNLAFVFLALAILFQPFLKISLGREIWNFVDVIIGIFLISSIQIENNPK